MNQKNSKIYVAGHRGLVGSAICRSLQRHGCENLVVRTSRELDLRDERAVSEFFEAERPEYVYLAAAKVGGIKANDTFPVEFLADNLAIEMNVIRAAHKYGVEKLLFLGSSCIYPRLAPQPIRENSLLTGPLEPTNDAYAIAKIAGIRLCQAYSKQYGARFISAMPTNLYGPGDNYDLERSHVLPALIRRFHEAKITGATSITLWGTGTPLREFLHSDDLADACVALMRDYESDEVINIGTGHEVTIRELAELVAKVTGFNGEVRFDPSMPDGTPRKLLDSSKIHALGWKPAIALEEGIRMVYDEFRRGPGERTI